MGNRSWGQETEKVFFFLPITYDPVFYDLLPVFNALGFGNY